MSHLVHLRTFLEVYRAKSFSKAATTLALTQPAITQHIQALESFVGNTLFIRKAKGVEPTLIADELARAVANNLDALELKLTSFKLGTQQGGTIHLAAPADFLYYRLTEPLARLMQQGFTIRCQTGNRHALYQLLTDNATDLAITASLPNENEFEFVPLLTERLLLVYSPKLEKIHGKNVGKNPTQDTLLSLPLIAFDESLALVRMVWQAIFEQTLDISATCVIPDLRTIKQMVLDGYGWTVLPDYHCQIELDNQTLIAVNNPKTAPTNQLYLVWKKGRLKPNVALVRDYLVSDAPA